MSFTISVAATRDAQDEPDERLSVVLQQGDALPGGRGYRDRNGNGHDHGLRTHRECDRTRLRYGGRVGHVHGRSDRRRQRSDALVRYTWTAGTAQAPGDFDAPSGTLTIPEGQTSGTITIVTKDDECWIPARR